MLISFECIAGVMGCHTCNHLEDAEVMVIGATALANSDVLLAFPGDVNLVLVC